MVILVQTNPTQMVTLAVTLAQIHQTQVGTLVVTLAHQTQVVTLAHQTPVPLDPHIILAPQPLPHHPPTKPLGLQPMGLYTSTICPIT